MHIFEYLFLLLEIYFVLRLNAVCGRFDYAISSNTREFTAAQQLIQVPLLSIGFIQGFELKLRLAELDFLLNSNLNSQTKNPRT